MARVKTDFRDAKKQISLYKLKAKQQLRMEMEKEIKSSIKRGVSPVKGFGRFVKYSQVYRDAIKSKRYSKFAKRVRPVNLKLSGELLKSLLVKITKPGISISFDNKLADIHNREGAGKSKTVRRILPTKPGEQFSRSITTRLKEVLDRVARNIFRN
jgi:hypothetical protein